MSGHGEKLTRTAEAAIAALLTEPTVEAAAAKAGIAAATLRRWLQRPEFLAAYRAARRRVVESAIARLQAAAEKAVAALERNLTGRRASNQIRAAVAILDRAVRGVELLDLAERVEALEGRR